MVVENIAASDTGASGGRPSPVTTEKAAREAPEAVANRNNTPNVDKVSISALEPSEVTGKNLEAPAVRSQPLPVLNPALRADYVVKNGDDLIVKVIERQDNKVLREIPNVEQQRINQAISRAARGENLVEPSAPRVVSAAPPPPPPPPPETPPIVENEKAGDDLPRILEDKSLKESKTAEDVADNKPKQPAFTAAGESTTPEVEIVLPGENRESNAPEPEVLGQDRSGAAPEVQFAAQARTAETPEVVLPGQKDGSEGDETRANDNPVPIETKEAVQGFGDVGTLINVTS